MNVKTSGLKIGVRTYFGLEVYLYTKHHLDIKSVDLLMEMDNLSKRIIEQYHQGQLFVKNSELGKGTTFKIVSKK